MSKFIISILLTTTAALIAPAAARAPANSSALYPAFERLIFHTGDGLHLNYARYPARESWPSPVVISPGCGESIYRYEPLVKDLRTLGYGPIFILEHRGQGYSEGTGLRKDLVHVEHFADYVRDFTDFVRGPVARDLEALGLHNAPFVIAHSMGGAIANLALRDQPDLARKVAYFSPMMDINTAILNPLNDRGALWAAQLLCIAGFCERVGVGGPGRARRLNSPGVRREVTEGIFRGGVTPGWLKEAIRATWRIRAEAHAHAEPALMITARRDRIVGNPALRTYAARAANTVLHEIDGRHGLHQDAATRATLVTTIDTFFRGCEALLTDPH